MASAKGTGTHGQTLTHGHTHDPLSHTQIVKSAAIKGAAYRAKMAAEEERKRQAELDGKQLALYDPDKVPRASLWYACLSFFRPSASKQASKQSKSPLAVETTAAAFQKSTDAATQSVPNTLPRPTQATQDPPKSYGSSTQAVGVVLGGAGCCIPFPSTTISHTQIADNTPSLDRDGQTQSVSDTLPNTDSTTDNATDKTELNTPAPPAMRVRCTETATEEANGPVSSDDFKVFLATLTREQRCTLRKQLAIETPRRGLSTPRTGMTPKLSSGTTPKLSSGTTPKLSSGTTPKLSSGTTPKLSSGTTPKLSSSSVSPKMAPPARTGSILPAEVAEDVAAEEQAVAAEKAEAEQRNIKLGKVKTSILGFGFKSPRSPKSPFTKNQPRNQTNQPKTKESSAKDAVPMFDLQPWDDGSSAAGTAVNKEA